MRPMAPAITQSPVNQSVAVGGTVQFTAAATGSPLPAFQWQVSTNGGATWTNVTNGGGYSGAQSATLTVTGALLTQNGTRYRAVATNSEGSIATAPARLTVTAAPGAELIQNGDFAAGRELLADIRLTDTRPHCLQRCCRRVRVPPPA